jgi:hypothetical protein
VERVLLKALAKERADRYATVTELVEAFKAAWQAAGVPMQGTAVKLPKSSIPDSKPPVKGLERLPEKEATKGTGESAGIQKPVSRRSPWSLISILGGTLLLICCLFVVITSLSGMLNQLLFAPTEPVLTTPGLPVMTLTQPSMPATLTATVIPDDRRLLFEDDFDSASPSAQALFGSDLMTFELNDGTGYLSSGYFGGVMPAKYDSAQLDDSVFEYDFLAPAPKAESSYGFIFRAEVAQDGSLDWYYLLGIAPTEETVIFSCWLYDQWSLEKSYFLPENLFVAGEYNHVVIEARGADFRAYLNDVLIMQESDPTIENPGIFGFYIIPGKGSNITAQDSVYFDNLRIYAPNTP